MKGRFAKCPATPSGAASSIPRVWKRFFLGTAAAVILGFNLAGCSGTSSPPDPMNPDQLKASLMKATPQQRADWINRSPGSAEEKAKLRKEYGVPDSMADGSPSGGR
jgi:hypothetical protein